LPRTGTSSLRKALRILGYEFTEDPFNQERLKKLFAGEYDFKEHVATLGPVISDLPYYAWWREALAQLPDAAVIWTTRECISWKQSMNSHFHKRAQIFKVDPKDIQSMTAQQQAAAVLMSAPDTWVEIDSFLNDAYGANSYEMNHLRFHVSLHGCTLPLELPDAIKWERVISATGRDGDKLQAWPCENRRAA
jgi:hypothetical protein